MKVGRYELLERIGVGGMGEVWKARDPDLGRRVAVKLLKNVEGDDLARFRREARTAASLSHPNIAAVYEAADGFIAMQLVEGENLDARPRDPREAAELVRQAAIAVHHAHVEGIVHRDLKPANIMVQDGRAYVMDFGLAKLLNVQSSLSHTGLVVGTPIFMAPEQARGETVGIATDVYSLGATLYALVAGCPPFVGDTPYEIIRRVIEDEPPPLRGDAQLASIVHKCLDKEASRRYATALDLAQDLERWLEGRPVRAKRPWRPNRRAWAVALLAILAIGGMTAGWAWKSRGMDRRLQLARERETDRRLGEARDEYRALLDQDPKNGPAREGLERVDAAIRECGAALEVVRASLHAAARYFYRPDFRRAELLRLLSVATHHLERAYRIQEPTAEMRYLRAESLEMAGDDAAAEAELRATLAIDPAYAPARLLLGKMLLARVFLSEEALLYGMPFALHEQGATIAEAMREIEASLGGGGPADDLERDVVRALVRCMTKGEVPLQDFLKDLIVRYEGREGVEEFHWLLALASFKNDRRAALDAALRIRPRHALALACRSAGRRMAGDDAGTISDLTELLEIKPNLVVAYVARAECRIRTGEYRTAIEDAETAMGFHPEDPSIRVVRARARVGLQDYRGALDDLNIALERTEGEDVAALHLRSKICATLGDHAGVIRDTTQLLLLLPIDVELRERRALAYLALRFPRQSLADLDAAIGFAPNEARLYRSRSEVKCTLSDYTGALEDAQVAVSLGPASPYSYLQRAIALRALNRQDQALDDYEAALRLAPKDWPFRGPVEAILRNAGRR